MDLPERVNPSAAIRDVRGLLGQPVTLFYDASGELVATWSGPLSFERALVQRLENVLRD